MFKPKKTKRKPFTEIQENRQENRVTHASSSKLSTRDKGIQCVVKCKDQSTQLGSESAVSLGLLFKHILFYHIWTVAILIM